MTKHTQVGPPAMVGNYRVRVISDSEHPHYLSKATWEGHDCSPGPGVTLVSGGPPNLDTIIVTEHAALIEHNSMTLRIPSDALEAVLKVAGWKVQRP